MTMTMFLAFGVFGAVCAVLGFAIGGVTARLRNERLTLDLFNEVRREHELRSGIVTRSPSADAMVTFAFLGTDKPHPSGYPKSNASLAPSTETYHLARLFWKLLPVEVRARFDQVHCDYEAAVDEAMF